MLLFVLSCEVTGSGPIRYQWKRVNGDISSDRAEGVNTATMTISVVSPHLGYLNLTIT